jgi:hypothetical protein
MNPSKNIEKAKVRNPFVPIKANSGIKLTNALSDSNENTRSVREKEIPITKTAIKDTSDEVKTDTSYSFLTISMDDKKNTG